MKQTFCFSVWYCNWCGCCGDVEAEDPMVLPLVKPLQHPTSRGLGGSTCFCDLVLQLGLGLDDWGER